MSSETKGGSRRAPFTLIPEDSLGDFVLSVLAILDSAWLKVLVPPKEAALIKGPSKQLFELQLTVPVCSYFN